MGEREEVKMMVGFAIIYVIIKNYNGESDSKVGQERFEPELH